MQLRKLFRYALLPVLLPALLLLGGCRASSQDAVAKDRSVALSAPLRDWLQSAGAEDRFETIITFHQREGMSRLDALGVRSTRLRQLPIAFARLTRTQVQALAEAAEVRSLWHEQRMRLYLDESVTVSGADQVARGSGLSRPYTGAGVRVAVIDTGVDGLHPDLPAGSKTEGYAAAGDPDLFDGGNPLVELIVPAPAGDTFGHGTHVASIISGLGVGASGADGDDDGDADLFVGMAPGSRIVSFKTDAGAFLLTGWILASFDWILDYNANPANLEKIRVSSNSWGCCDGVDYQPDDPTHVAIKALYDSGVTVIFAASNSGGPDTLNAYATSPWVVSVAAGTKDKRLADFSSRGRIDGNWDRRRAQREETGLYRPTLTAPGEDIEAARSTQSGVMAIGTDLVNPLYTFASGTSMAAPHVAGAVALMLEANPALGPEQVIDILEGTADPMAGYEMFETGAGHLDTAEAVLAAEQGRVKFPPSQAAQSRFVLRDTQAVAGTAQSGTWLLRPASGNCQQLRTAKSNSMLSFHSMEVPEGIGAVYAEIEWADRNQLVYLVLYDPACNEAGVSAALLDIGSVRRRALVATHPVAGEWTMAIYGRANLPTPYKGAFSTYDKR